jgi:hypothetical protein
MLVALLDRHFIDYKFLDSATLNVRTVAIAMPNNLLPKKSIANPKRFAGLLFPLATGVALAATTIFADSAKAFPVLIDDFSNTTSAITVFGSGSSSSAAVPITGTQLSGASRGLGLTATQLGTSPLTSSLDINPGTVALSAPVNHTATATLNYTGFSATNLTTGGNDSFAFDVDYDFATNAAPITVSITANGSSTKSIVLNSGGGGEIVPLKFFFADFNDPSVFSSLTSLVVSVTSGRGNDLNISSAIRAVPVPPAFVGTLLAAGLAAVKARKKKPALAGKSEV